MQARRTEMTKTVRERYTLEFKQEAVRLVTGGQSIAAAARSLGVVVAADNYLERRVEFVSQSLSAAQAGGTGATEVAAPLR
jgi:transposase-like protein